MNTDQDRKVAALLRDQGHDPVDVHTERDTGEITWARFKGDDGYFTVEASWDVNSTPATIAAELANKVPVSGRGHE